MRYIATLDVAMGETRIEMESNCYTDAYPMLRQLQFRKQDIDLTSQSLPLACAILTAAYCGDQFEFRGIRVGGDYAEALQKIIGRSVTVANVDGHNRAISTGEIDVFCERSSDPTRISDVRRLPDSVPFVRTDWSADFVDVRSRRSEQFAFGAYQTNAEIIADRTLVSIAVGVLHGRDRCRTLYVPVSPEGDARKYVSLHRALRTVGITLELLA